MNSKKSYGTKIDLSLSTWTKLARAFATVNKVASDNIRSFGLTLPQFSVIEALGHLGELKIGELCDKMLVSGGNMTLVIDNLEKNGIVERVHSKKDRRAINVKLTEKGIELFEKIFQPHAETIDSAMSILSEPELDNLGNTLKKLGLGIKN